LDPYVNSHLYNDLGFDISTSVPIQSATLADYAKQELLLRHGGLVNLYGSLAGKNFANAIYKWGDRASNIDRSYFVDTLQHVEPATAQQAMLFWSHGLGIKALKTQLEGTGDIGLQGTVYLGIGADGPLFVRDIDSAKVGERKACFQSKDSLHTTTSQRNRWIRCSRSTTQKQRLHPPA